jgi:hypothetical protein
MLFHHDDKFRKSHKNATKCNETHGKWCKNKHGASKIIDTLETYQPSSWEPQEEGMMSTAASFSLRKKPRFIETKVYRIQEKVNTPEGDAD